MSKEKKKTLINVCLHPDDKRTLILQRIFNNWKANGHNSKTDQVIQNLILLNSMEKSTSVSLFLSNYRHSYGMLSSLLTEQEEDKLYEAIDEVYAEALQQAQGIILQKQYEVYQRLLYDKKSKSMPQPTVAPTSVQPTTPVEPINTVNPTKVQQQIEQEQVQEISTSIEDEDQFENTNPMFDGLFDEAMDDGSY